MLSHIFDQGYIPPSAIVKFGLYMRSGSISDIVPSPAQVGQAPAGALKEKRFGSSLGKEDPSERTKLSEYKVSFLESTSFSIILPSLRPMLKG